jgi:hypothetical protein
MFARQGSTNVTDIPAGPVSPPPLPPAPPLPPQPYQGAGGAAPVEVGIAGPATQSRLTVLFRLIMAIPHLIVLYVLGIAAEVVLVIGWFGALFTGALPQFAADFLTGVLRWHARVAAYLLLLTDQYPPFSLEDADYPVRVAVRTGPLNRLAVFFRFILIIPAAIVVGVVAYGLETITLVVIWLIVLITGRMPSALHDAIRAVLRYVLRCIGYLLLLTSEYPRGLFGDRPGPGGLPGTAPYPDAGYPDAATPGFPSAAGSAPAPAQPPAYGDQQVSDTEGYQAVSGTGPAPAWGTPAPAWGQPAQPGSTTPGDEAPPQEAGYGAPPPAAGYGAQPGSTTPGYGAQPPAAGYGAPPPAAGYGAPPPAAGYGAPPPAAGYGAPPPAAGYGAQTTPGAPGYGASSAVSTAGWSVPGSPPWPLVLSQGAKRLVGLFIALGVIIAVAYFVFIAVVVGSAKNDTANRAVALSQSTAAFSRLSTSMTAFGNQTTACKGSHTPLSCVTAADQQASSAFAAYASIQGGIGMPTSSTLKASTQLVSDATRAQQVFRQLAASKSVTQYEQTVTASNLQQVLNQLELTYRQLQTTLAK